MTEDQVIDALLLHLPRHGHEFIGFAKGNNPGWDVGTRYEGALCAIEAKGISPYVPHHKQTARSELIWDSGYARLVQIAAGRKYLYRPGSDGRRVCTGENQPAYVCLAVSDTAGFRNRFCWFKDHMEATGFGVWFVGKDGLDPVLYPRPIR